MNLYKISQREKTGYDTYSEAVVAANSVEEARRIHPHAFFKWIEDHVHWAPSFSDKAPVREECRAWANNIENVKVEVIGVADSSVEPGVVLASFHAG